MCPCPGASRVCVCASENFFVLKTVATIGFNAISEKKTAKKRGGGVLWFRGQRFKAGRVRPALVVDSRRCSMQVELKNGKLIITVELSKGTPSKSGKTLVLASTHGNVQTAVQVNGQPVVLGMNAYVRNPGALA